MNELKNVATIIGIYKNNQITLNSKTVKINMIDELIIQETVNKNIWYSGNITYSLIIDNQTNKTYFDLQIKDLLDTNLISLINDSVKINEVQTNNYIYNNGILIINLDKIENNSKTIINFSIKKKTNDFFILKNNFKLEYDLKILESNYVTVTSLIKKGFSNNNYCGKPYWRS